MSDKAKSKPAPGGAARRAVEGFGSVGLALLFSVRAAIDGLGQVTIMLAETAAAAVRPPYRLRLLFEAMEEVGVGALNIVLLTGGFTGMVMALQTILALRVFGAEALVGGSVAIALVRELIPVLTGLMVSGRSGSAMATTLGTMRVTEQIDAMEVMAVSSLQYLVAPRIIATLIMLPLLTLLANFTGMVGAYVVAIMLDIDGAVFIAKISEFAAPADLFKCTAKAAFFGAAISVLSCYRGYYAAGGAKGVGDATTSAVVLSSVSILISNYFLDLLLW